MSLIINAVALISGRPLARKSSAPLFLSWMPSAARPGHQIDPAGPTFHSPFDYYPELLNLVSWLQCHLCRRYSLRSSTADTGATGFLLSVLISFGWLAFRRVVFARFWPLYGLFYLIAGLPLFFSPLPILDHFRLCRSCVMPE